jgi:hypothetical protein
VIAPAKTGSDSSSNRAIMEIDHTNSGIRSGFMLETKTNTRGSNEKGLKNYIMRSTKIEFFTKHCDDESKRRNEPLMTLL